jgi:hypothetical protein
LQEEYDSKLADALSCGCSVDEANTINLEANYRKGIAATLRPTLNDGERSSRQPGLTPNMQEMTQKLTQEQYALQMASQHTIVQRLLQKQPNYFDEQLTQFRQGQGWPTNGQHGNAQNVRAHVFNDKLLDKVLGILTCNILDKLLDFS